MPNEGYQFNINYYKNNTGGSRPVIVSTKVTRTDRSLNSLIVDERKIILLKEDAESTVVRFALNDEGNVTMKHHVFETLLPVEEK